MKRNNAIFFLFSLYSLFCSPLYAQEQPEKKNAVKWFLNTFDNVTEFLMGCDTNYVTPQLYEFTTQAELSYYHDYYRVSSYHENETNHMTLQTTSPMTLGGYVYWGIFGYGRTWTLGESNAPSYRNTYTLNLARFFAELYTFKTGRNTKFTDVSGIDLSNKDTRFRGLNSDCFGLDVQYIFNNKHYSWPAAFGANAVQRKSAGSWKLGFTYDKISIDLDHSEIPDYIKTKADTTLFFNEINYYDYALSFGYSYNWVFKKNCLLAISVIPSLGYRRTNVDAPEGYILNNLTTDIFFRASLFWNSTRFFSGLMLDLHTYSYREKKFGLTNTFGTVKFITGLNFLKKSKYRIK